VGPLLMLILSCSISMMSCCLTYIYDLCLGLEAVKRGFPKCMLFDSLLSAYYSTRHFWASRCVLSMHLISYIKPNEGELMSMADAIREQQGLPPLPRPCQLSDPAFEPPLSSFVRKDSNSQSIVTSDGDSRLCPSAGGRVPMKILQLVPFAGVLLSTGMQHCIQRPWLSLQPPA
jgi:hypothetical protein